MLAAADAPAELVQLRQAEAVRAFDQHQRRVRDVDADLHDGRGHQPGHLAGGAALPPRPLLASGPAAVEQLDAVGQVGELLRLQPLELLGGGARGDRLGAFDERADDEDLVAGLHLAPYVLKRLVAALRR